MNRLCTVLTALLLCVLASTARAWTAAIAPNAPHGPAY
jgi:hypothetical protein